MSEHHDQPPPSAISAALAAPRRMPSSYPEAFALRMAGRSKQPLGEVFGLAHFGVNLTTLAPGAVSALHHAHSRQDEFVYVLLGRPLLRTGDETTALAPGMCAGWRAGSGIAHQLFNPGPEDAVFLEVYLNVQITRRTTIDARFAFAGEADAVALVDARRDLDGERLLPLHPTGAVAGLARVAYHLAATMALRLALWLPMYMH